MKLYRIREWNERYENNRTRELKKLDWVPVPNKQDGEGYTLTVLQDCGPALLGAWLVILQTASKCGIRGTLMRDTGKPHDANSIARLTRFPVGLIEQALDWFTSDEMQWMEIIELEANNKIPHLNAVIPHDDERIPQEGDLEGKGIEGNNNNGGFFDFWREYPRHTNRKKSREIWDRQKLNRFLDEILEAISEQKKTEQWKRGVIPHPSTWLNGRRWEDEIDPFSISKNGVAKITSYGIPGPVENHK
jgi:hypothetical protein